jgi:hypothetical protein
VAVAGNRAYVAAQGKGLIAVDVRNGDRPVVLGPLRDATNAIDVVVSGSRVYVADVGTPAVPAGNARVDLWARMHMWGVEGRPQVALGLAGLHIAEPTADGLRSIGLYLSPAMIESVAVDEASQTMYLADGYAGVIVLDASDPVHLALLGSLSTPGVAHDVRIYGTRLLVAAGPTGVLLVDIAKPRDPRLAAVIDTPGEALGVWAVGNLAYVADGEVGGLRVLDLARQKEIGGVDTPGMAWDVVVGSNFAFVSDRSALRVYDVTNPTAPKAVDSALQGEGDVLDTALDGSYAWVAAGPSGVHLYDVSDPRTLRPLAALPLRDRAIGIVADEPQAYVAAGTAGLLALERSAGEAVTTVARSTGTTVHLRETASWSMPGAAERLCRYGDWVLVAAEMGGLQVVRAPH